MWNIYKIEDLYLLINLINGYFRTPKYYKFIELINWINNYININNTLIINNNNILIIYNINKKKDILSKINYIIVKPIDNSPLESNSWLAGFSDADSNFNIQLYKKKNNKNYININYRLEIKQKYNYNNSYINYDSYFFIIKIANIFNSNLLSRERKLKLNKQKEYKLYYLYIISVNSINNLIIVNNYFNKYPLLSSKYFYYKKWSILLIYRLKINSTTNIDIIKLYKDINNNKLINWDHLNNNYYLK